LFSNLIPFLFVFSEKETHEKYLKHIEEDQEHDMRQLEEKIREEVNDQIYNPKVPHLFFLSRNKQTLILNVN
jgi:hypothetical protein